MLPLLRGVVLSDLRKAGDMTEEDSLLAVMNDEKDCECFSQSVIEILTFMDQGAREGYKGNQLLMYIYIHLCIYTCVYTIILCVCMNMYMHLYTYTYVYKYIHFHICIL